MPFSWDNFPYTNCHELNLDWFIKKFKEIFDEWESLYTTLTQWKEDTDADLAQWKEDTDADLAQWKEDTLADMTSWENDLLDALDEWKAATGEDIGEWESGVISDLNDWKDNFIAAYEELEDRVEAIVSDTEDMVENLAEPFSTNKNYSANDYVIYNGVLYVFTEYHSAGAWIGSDAEQTTAMNDITDLKNDITSSTDYFNDNTAYIFRESCNGADIGNHEFLQKIIGGTVSFNQLVRNGNFATNSNWSSNNATQTISDGTLSFTKTASGGYGLYQEIRLVKNHKILRFLDIKGASGVTYSFNNYFDAYTGTGAWEQIHKISTAVSTGQTYFMMTTNESSDFAECKIRNVMNFDLTLMFGQAVANAISALEEATPGAGAKWFKKLFPKDYYTTTFGVLTHVSNLQSHKTVGFNAYDPSTGTAKLLGGVKYQITGDYSALTYVGYGGTETLDVDAHGVFKPKFDGTLTITGGNSANTCVHIVGDGSKNNAFEAYKSKSYALDDSLVLRGMPKLDGSNHLYYDGDTYTPDGTVTRKYGIVDLGSLTWDYVSSANYPRFYATSPIADMKAQTDQAGIPNALCGRYAVTSKNAGYYGTDTYCVCFHEQNYIWIYDTGYTDGAALKSSLTGVYLIYELASTTTEEADPYEETQQVSALGTEEFVTTSIVPVGNETKYSENLLNKIDYIPSYYKDLLDIKEKQINEQIMALTSGDAFVFITDPHYDANRMLSAQIVGNVCKTTGITTVQVNGDYITKEENKKNALYETNRIMSMFRYPGCYTYATVGNHEYNNPNAQYTTAALAITLTDAEMRFAFINPIKNRVVAYDTETISYCYDNPVAKIRYFVGEVDLGSAIVTNSVKWIAQQMESVPDDYGVVIIFHTILKANGTFQNDTTGGSLLENILNAARNHTSYTSGGVTYNYSGKSFEMIAAFCGDIHKDITLTTSAGVPVICTTTDSLRENGSLDRVPGTTTEQAFDVVVINRTSKKIYCNRIGAGLDRVITYQS